MEFLFEYGLFLAKAVTLVVAIVLTIGLILSIASKQKGSSSSSLELESLSEHFEDIEEVGKQVLLSKDELKQQQKEDKKRSKEKAKEKQADKKNLFVIDFVGGAQAKEVSNLRKEITAILCIAKKDDEVLVKVESGGGVVHGYGLAASQLMRLRDKGLQLTISIDKVAASGGYLMACVANKIISAPFAIVGSIGVIAQLPNFSKVLKKNDIDFEQHTAGEFKRTLTVFGENTDEGREKFQSELEEVHQMFKQFVSDNRPHLDIAKVATGEYWYGTKAKELDLVDDIQTSDDFLLAANADKKIFKVKYAAKKNLPQKLGLAVSNGIESGFASIVQKARHWYH